MDPSGMAWLNTLSADEYAWAHRLLEIPEDQRTVWLAVEVHRLNLRVEQLSRPFWKQAASGLGLFFGGMLAAFAGAKGWRL